MPGRGCLSHRSISEAGDEQPAGDQSTLEGSVLATARSGCGSLVLRMNFSARSRCPAIVWGTVASRQIQDAALRTESTLVGYIEAKFNVVCPRGLRSGRAAAYFKAASNTLHIQASIVYKRRSSDRNHRVSAHDVSLAHQTLRFPLLEFHNVKDAAQRKNGSLKAKSIYITLKARPRPGDYASRPEPFSFACPPTD